MRTSPFKTPERIEDRYLAQLTKIAQNCNLVLEGIDPNSAESMEAARRALETYATVIEHWSRAVSLGNAA